MIRTSNYVRPVRAAGSREMNSHGAPKQYTLGVEYSRGLHAGEREDALPPGFSPHMENAVIRGGALQARSGLSVFGSGSGAGANARHLGAFRFFDDLGNQHLLVTSDKTIARYDNASGGWTALSGLTSWTTTSGTSRDYMMGAEVYDPHGDKILAVLTNNVDPPKYIELGATVGGYSDLTAMGSLVSRARSVAASDNRLVFFNVYADGKQYAQRVVWSVRGEPRNATIANGAGFEDLLDMRGEGTRIISDRDGIALFSDAEVWRGRVRRDAYAFDFYPVERSFGAPYRQAIARTPWGIAFLGADYEVYILTADAVAPLGPPRDGGTSRIQGKLREELLDAESAFMFYDAGAKRLHLHYTDSEGVDPKRALFYDFEQDAWTAHEFSEAFTVGVEVRDPGVAGPSWDEGSGNWDTETRSWDALGRDGVDYAPMLVSAGGVPKVLAGNDPDGIEWVWRSPVFKSPEGSNPHTLSEFWVEYSSAGSSSLSVAARGALGNSVSSVTPLSLVSTDYGRAVAHGHFVQPRIQYELRGVSSDTLKVGSMEVIARRGGGY